MQFIPDRQATTGEKLKVLLLTMATHIANHN
jgi:hypothetical protein